MGTYDEGSTNANGAPENMNSPTPPAREKREPPCPITHRPYFMHIEHPDLGDVPTYGGPLDSYTVPEPDEDGHFHSEHYCHDRGDWIEGGNPEGLMLVTEREYNELVAALELEQTKRRILTDAIEEVGGEELLTIVTIAVERRAHAEEAALRAARGEAS